MREGTALRDADQGMPKKTKTPRAARVRDPIQEFYAVVRGVRGSYNAADKECLGFGGHTISLEVRAGGHILVFDAGTGIISLGEELMAEHAARPNGGPVVVSLFISHTHHDHVHGLPFFEPAHSRVGKINVYGLRPLNGDLTAILRHQVDHSYFPLDLTEMAAIQEVRSLGDRDVVVFGEPGTLPTVEKRITFDAAAHQDQVLLYPQKNTAHPKGGTLFFRVEYLGRSLVFATDTEGYVGGDTRLINFARDATLLVHDTQYTYEEYRELRQGWGHSTIEMAAAVAKQADVKHMAMFHYDPCYNDTVVEGLERAAQGIFPNTFAPREGDRIDLLTL